MTVFEALERELKGMPKPVRDSTIAAGARVAAQILDGRPGTRDTASLLKELRAAMADLQSMADAVPEEADPIDELKRRRAARVPESAVQDRASGGGQHLGS